MTAPDFANMSIGELRSYEDALEKHIGERRLAAEVEKSMTVMSMNCFGKGRVLIPANSEPDENGILHISPGAGVSGILEMIQAQHMDIQPGEVSDEAAVALVKGSGVVGAVIAMSGNGFTGEQMRDVLRRSGLTDAEIDAELDEIQSQYADDELDGHPEQG